MIHLADTSKTAAPATYEEIYAARGVAISGMEWGDHRTGTGPLADQETYTYFADKGFELFRLAISWERIQPVLHGPLSEEFLGHLRDNIRWAKAAGANSKVIIDIHNYAKYDQVPIDTPGGPTTADFADLWVRLSDAFRDEPAVYAYGLMNEPAYVGYEEWYAISQAAVSAIRANGDTKLIAVPGPEWSGAHKWPVDREPWIEDPADNLLYEAHQYFDINYGGSYRDNYETINAHFGGDVNAFAAAILQRWADWLNKYRLRGLLGEFATPYDEFGPLWNTVLDTAMQVLEKNGISSSYWAAGTGWDPKLNAIIQPRGGKDAPQMAVLTKYPSGIVKVYR